MPRPPSARAAALLALVLAAGHGRALAASDGGGGEAADGGPPLAEDGGAAEADGGPVPDRAFAAKVTGVDRASRKLTVEWAGREVAMTFDRNTQVYLADRLGTLLDLAPGVEVRAARSATGLAIWVEVLRGAAAPDAGPAPSPPPGTRP